MKSHNRSKKPLARLKHALWSIANQDELRRNYEWHSYRREWRRIHPKDS